jgi:apolipoprotein N-acyltransferase
MKNSLIARTQLLQLIILGACIPLGFAPFGKPALLWLAMLFFYLCLDKDAESKFQPGFFLGIGINLMGTSWIYVSIHEYGHLHPLIATFFTLLFILFISTFYGMISFLYQSLKPYCHFSIKPLLFAACWCTGEWIKSHCFGGFPWLNLGFSALNSPFSPLLAWFGIYGPSFIICSSMAYLALGIQQHGLKRLWGILGLGLFFLPQFILHIDETPKTAPVHISIIQGNVKSQDKWDEQLFWQQFYEYVFSIKNNLKPQQLIILPEAAITVPSTYVQTELKQLDAFSKKHHSAILFGIPQAANQENEFYNSLMALGEAKGNYHKQQLVPFGESIPHLFVPLMQWLGLPVVNTISGDNQQAPITVFNQAIASLICYELAYPERLRHQLPQGQWIVSISDDGWFGHSLALHQHLQMAQVLSLMAQRDHVFVNNNGLSSLINAHGEIISQLPAWQKEQLVGQIHPHQSITPWMSWGDKPVILLCLCILSFAILNYSFKIRRLRNSAEWSVNT